MAILETRSLTRRFGALTAVDAMTISIDALRAMMLSGRTSNFGLGAAFHILLAATVVLVMIGARLYPRVVI